MPDDSPKRTSLAEMARIAAQKSLRPPANAALSTPPPMRVPSLTPAPPSMFPSSPPGAPPSSMRTGDSGMVHLHELTSSPAIEPEIIAAVPVPASSTAGVMVDTAAAGRPVSSRPAPKTGRGTSWLLVAGVVVLAGAAAAAVAASRGLTAKTAAERVMAVFRPAPTAASIAPFQPTEERAPAVAEPATAQPAAAPPAQTTAEDHAATTPDSKPANATAHHATKAVTTHKTAEVTTPVAPTPKPAPTPATLANAMAKAAAPEPAGGSLPPPAPPPETGPSDVPEIPPQGAILGAIGARRQAARTCVRGMTSPSRATLVFASSGKVQSVSVSGAAAGTPAESCLKNVFKKASVEPFRRATYTSSTNISP
jgi:LPXTG-motif cell wall-anchored protein